jgi:hypothetical protein
VFATVAILALVIVALGAGAATGKLPLVTQTWEKVSSAIASAVPSSSPSVSAGSEPSSGAEVGAASAAGDAGGKPHFQPRPLSSAQLGAPLVHGTFVSACGAPDDMKVVMKVDVKMGRAVKVAVKTNPPNPTVAACIEQAARDLRWDASPKTGHVTVTY